MHAFFRTLKIISLITLFFFSWTYLPMYQIAAYAAEEKQNTVASRQKTGEGKKPKKQRTEEKFEKALEKIREKIEKAEEKSRRGDAATEEIKAIKIKKSEIETLDIELKKDFAATEKKLKDAKLPKKILDRHYKFVKHYENNMAELKANLEAVEQYTADSKQGRAALKRAKIHLEKTKPPKRHTPLDPNKLPHRLRKVKKAKKPRTKREEFERDFPSKKRKKKLATDGHRGSRGKGQVATGYPIPDPRSLIRNNNPASGILHPVSDHKPILVASAGSLAGLMDRGNHVAVHDATPWRGLLHNAQLEFPIPDSPFSSFAPSPSPDVSPSGSLMLAQATVDLPTADDLSQTPEVQFTQEIQELAERLNKNSLTIFEFVRNNFKYEPYFGSLKGAQQTLREKAGNDFDLASLLIALYRASNIEARYVLGTISMPLSQAQGWLGLDEPRMVGRLLASAGIPVAVDYAAGIIRMEHIWVQAWVPFQNGRGALNGPGDTWVFMDPSFKETQLTQILKHSIPSFDQAQYLSQFRPEHPTEYYSTLIQDYLNTNSPGHTVYAISGRREIISHYFQMLIGMPQYDIVSIGGILQEIPDHFRHKITFELRVPESIGSSLTYHTSTVELASKRITLSYSPATADDQATINRYGDIFNTPAFLVKLTPELRVEGLSVAQGLPITFGDVQPFVMKFSSPGLDSEQVMNNAVAGAYYAVGLDLQTVNRRMVLERTEKLRSISDIIAAGGPVNQDDHTGEILYATALEYFQKLDAANKKAQELLKMTDLRGVSEAIVKIDLMVHYLFNIPRSVTVSGMTIDVDRDIHLPLPISGDLSLIKEYNLLIGSNSSYFEHDVFEDIYPVEAVSAVKALQYASNQGIQVYTVTKDNVNNVLPTLQVSSEVKTNIENAVNAEKEVIVPQRDIILNDWSGAGYIVMNPESGEAAYVISGGFSGGSSTSVSFLTWVKANVLTITVAAYVLIDTIEASIDYGTVSFAGKDNQLGTSDDVKIPVVEGKMKRYRLGPANTRCAGQSKDTFTAPHQLYAANLIQRVDNDPALYLSKNIKFSDMISDDSSIIARISPGLISILDEYITLIQEEDFPFAERIISSGYRAWYHNCTVKKAVDTSAHMDGLAADVDLDQSGISDEDRLEPGGIASVLMGNKGNVGYEAYDGDYVHVDIYRGNGGGKRW